MLYFPPSQGSARGAVWFSNALFPILVGIPPESPFYRGQPGVPPGGASNARGAVGNWESGGQLGVGSKYTQKTAAIMLIFMQELYLFMEDEKMR